MTHIRTHTCLCLPVSLDIPFVPSFFSYPLFFPHTGVRCKDRPVKANKQQRKISHCDSQHNQFGESLKRGNQHVTMHPILGRSNRHGNAGPEPPGFERANRVSRPLAWVIYTKPLYTGEPEGQNSAISCRTCTCCTVNRRWYEHHMEHALRNVVVNDSAVCHHTFELCCATKQVRGVTSNPNSLIFNKQSDRQQEDGLCGCTGDLKMIMDN